MLVPRADYYDVYKQIQTLSFQQSVLVFASNGDADALCAYKILTDLFKPDSIAFSVIPVTSGDHLQQQAETHLSDETEDRAIVLINCGGSEDVQKLLPPLAENSRVFVIDSHRPLHVNNVRASNKGVLVLYEEEMESVKVRRKRKIDLLSLSALFEYVVHPQGSSNTTCVCNRAER